MMTAEMPDIAGQSVSRETFHTLFEFGDLVRRWTSAVNLVSKSSVAELWDRHIVDSAQIFAYCPQDAESWMDIGSGGGFPGIVVAILAHEKRPQLHVTLAESDLRKATFLRQAAQTLGLDVTVRSERIESLSPAGADVLSARALAGLPDLLGHAERHLREGGVALFPKGARFAEEIAAARTAWTFDVTSHPSLSEPDAAILEIRKIHRAKQD